MVSEAYRGSYPTPIAVSNVNAISFAGLWSAVGLTWCFKLYARTSLPRLPIGPSEANWEAIGTAHHGQKRRQRLWVRIKLFGLPIRVVVSPTECHFQWRLEQSEHRQYRPLRRSPRHIRISGERPCHRGLTRGMVVVGAGGIHHLPRRGKLSVHKLAHISFCSTRPIDA